MTLAALARWCYRRRRLVVGLWVIGFLVMSVVGGVIGSAYTNNFSGGHSDSVAAFDLLKARFPARAGDTTDIVFTSPRGVTSPEVRGAVERLLAEVGPTVDPFPTAGQFASWAGMCPGNNESAGKRRTGRTTKGNRWLRQAVVQAGWAASHSKTTYLGARYRRVARRRGAKRALMAVGHTLLVIVYQVLRKREAYRELGADYYDQLQPERLARRLVRRLEQLGHKVTLEARATPEPQAQPV